MTGSRMIFGISFIAPSERRSGIGSSLGISLHKQEADLLLHSSHKFFPSFFMELVKS